MASVCWPDWLKRSVMFYLFQKPEWIVYGLVGEQKIDTSQWTSGASIAAIWFPASKAVLWFSEAERAESHLIPLGLREILRLCCLHVWQQIIRSTALIVIHGRCASSFVQQVSSWILAGADSSTRSFGILIDSTQSTSLWLWSQVVMIFTILGQIRTLVFSLPKASKLRVCTFGVETGGHALSVQSFGAACL